MSNEEKLLTDMEFREDKKKKEQMRLADVPAEDFDDNDSETETETSSGSSDSDSNSEYECSVCNRRFPEYLSFRQHEKGKKHAKMLSKKKMERKLLERGAEDGKGTEGDEQLIPEPYAICKTCNKEFPGPESYYLHLRSKAHKNKNLKASILEQVRENGEINLEKLKELYNNKRKSSKDGGKGAILSAETKDDEGTSHEEFECKDCRKVFNGLTSFSQHLMSKTHAKQIEKKKMLHEVLPGPSEETKCKDLSTLILEDDILVCKLCSTSFNGPESAMMHLKSKNHAKKLDKYVRKIEKKKEKKEEKASSQKEKEIQEGAEAAKEEHQPTSDTSCHNNPTSQEAASDDKFENSEVYEKYKEYKKLINSLEQKDVVIK